jgi:hypothetical protein
LTGRLKVAIGAAAACLAAASLFTWPKPVDNPGPLLTGARIEPPVLAILERSCADCHSDATRYPWYSYVAPVSFLIASDVQRGRRHLNLSRWPDYPLVRKQRLLSEIANQVKEREMPLWIYTVIHRGSPLSAAEIDTVFEWTQAERARLIATGATPQ